MAKEKVSRKIQIMQTLASMLEDREPVKITTAELAKRTNITEAAIYRHFPSKRRIYQELVEFFEDSIFPRIASIKKESAPDEVAGNIVMLILTFCDKNKGISKILNREALSVDESKIEDTKKVFCFGRLTIIVLTPAEDIKVTVSPTFKSKVKLNSLPTEIWFLDRTLLLPI